MNAKIAHKVPALLIVVFALLFAKLHFNKRSEGKDTCFNICGDARGYYAWLPAIFIHNDLNFKFFDTVEMTEPTCGGIPDIPIQDYRYYFDGKACNKYYPGSSFMMLPVFAVAHITTKYFSDYPANGYSYYYYKLMPLAAILYYLMGMLLLLGILNKLKLNTLQKSLTIVLVTFGTNVIYYVIDAPLYSHIYSFALSAAFLYYAFCLKEMFSARNIIALSFITGLIFITRPVNVSILLVLPFILGGQLKTTWRNFTNSPTYLMYLASVLIMPAALFTLYKLSTGKFLIYSYVKEGFDFLRPHFWQFLFHYDNGVFLYMPLLLMPFVFLFAWYKREYRSLIIGIAATMLVTFYIHSSWWFWSYSFSFGARTILDFIPLFGIVIGLSLKQTNLKRYLYLLPVYFLCCGLTMLLYHQKSAGHYMGVYPITDYWDAIYNALGIK